MADFLPAVTKTLAAEGGFFHDPVTGEVVNFGVNVWFLRGIGVLRGVGAAKPDEIAFVQNMTRDYAINLYRTHFWAPSHFELLDSQKLADKVFDLAVNMGPPYSAIKLLQYALNDLTQGNYEVDGILGPITAKAVNAADQDALYAGLLRQAEARYHKIAQNPELASDLDGWLKRLYS